MAAILRDIERQLNNTSGEYLAEDDYLALNHAKLMIKSSLPLVTITGVSKVNNNYLKGMYELKKQEYKARYRTEPRELKLFHATSAFKVDSIIKSNLDWRRVCRNKFGMGVSFSNDADYANYYSNQSNGEKRAFIIANVLIHNTIGGSYGTIVPPLECDTTTGNNGKVYVKYYDNEFLPLYVVYYNAPERCTSKYFRVHRPRYLFL